jgi:hypothetical protein
MLTKPEKQLLVMQASLDQMLAVVTDGKTDAHWDCVRIKAGQVEKLAAGMLVLVETLRHSLET